VRELTKSMLSFSWAMSMFGLKQMANALTPSNAVASFEALTRCTEDQLGPTARAAFRACDNLQRGLVDLTFTFLGPGSGRGNSGRGILGPDGGGRGDRDQGVRSWVDAGQQAGGTQGGGDQQGGWNQGGGGEQGGWNQGDLGGGWSISGGSGATAAGADIDRILGDLTGQAVSGGIDLWQQGIDAAARTMGGGSTQQPGGTGGDQESLQSGDYQTPGGSQ
jgi:hypothetical protein